MLGAVVGDVLNEVGLILHREDDGDFAVRLGAVFASTWTLANCRVAVRMRQSSWNFVGGVDGAGSRFDLGHNLGGGHEAIALNEYVANKDAAGGRRRRRLGQTGHAAQEYAQQSAGAAERRRIKAIHRLHGLIPVVSKKPTFAQVEGDG